MEFIDEEEITDDVWFQEFEKYGLKFAENRDDYSKLSDRDREIGVLFVYELDMYNNGFLQAFCNWGYEGYLLEIKALEKLQAYNSKDVLERCFSFIKRFKDDPRAKASWDVPGLLTEEEKIKLSDLEELYKKDLDSLMTKMYKFYIDKE